MKHSTFDLQPLHYTTDSINSLALNSSRPSYSTPRMCELKRVLSLFDGDRLNKTNIFQKWSPSRNSPNILGDIICMSARWIYSVTIRRVKQLGWKEAKDKIRVSFP